MIAGMRRQLAKFPISSSVTAVATLIGGLATVAGVIVAVALRDGAAESGPVGASVEELAHATVQITSVDKDGERFPIGSGSIISEDGLILMAAHLVENEGSAYDHLEVATTDDLYKAPSGNHRAQVEAVDYALDLAVIKIEVVNLPFVRMADSEPGILNRIRILGYPGTGGETLTASVGTVSGFASAANINGRAWIKTDDTVTGGSSGAMAVNDDGELIGVVVEFGSGSRNADLVDCRAFIADANKDGLLDDADGCIPVGGFINALRPVELAEPLIREGREYKSDLATPAPYLFSDHDTSMVLFENLVFSGDGVTTDRADDEVAQALESGVKEICGNWRYSGMADGMRWDAVWYIDGTRYDVPSLARQRWTGGPNGNHSVCIPGSLEDGTYELYISVEGALQGSRQIADVAS